MNNEITISDKLTRIDNAVDRIRVATGTVGEIIEDVATAVEANVEVEEKDVNFYDYDGRRVYSYTASEFANLTEMPENPTHEGLTAQGWNWSLSDAKTYVAEYEELDVGQLYVTDDNSTRLYIEIPMDNFEITTGVSSAVTMSIDWGDGSEIETKTTGSKSHTYTNKGKYIIKMTSDGVLGLSGNINTGSQIITKNTTSTSNYNRVCFNTLKKVEFGNNVSLNIGSFLGLQCLETIVGMPVSTTIPDSCFKETSNLKCFVVKNGVTSLDSSLVQSSRVKLILPNTITTIGSSALNQYLYKISLPSSLTSIGSYGMSNIQSAPYLKIPASVNTISTYGFSGSNGAAYFDFSHHTSIPSLGSSAFYIIQAEQKIIVPDDLYEDWIVATNWSTYASQIVKASGVTS